MREGPGGRYGSGVPRWRLASPRLEKLDWRLVVASLVLASLLVRAAYRVEGLFFHDSVVLAQAVEQTVATGRLHGQVDGRYGSVLLNLPAYAACHWIGGLERAEATVIWTNIAFGSAAVGTLALLLMELLRSRAASLLGAALFSVSPIYLSITTYGKPHGIEAFLVLTSLWLVLRSARTGSTTEAALGSVALGAAILTRESTLIDLPIFALAALRPRLSLRPLKLHVGGPARRPARLLAASLPAVLIVGVA